MRYQHFAIETETHSADSTTHYMPYARQEVGKFGRWTTSCGRLVTGEVWEAGTVEGVRCKQCMNQEAKWEARHNKRYGVTA